MTTEPNLTKIGKQIVSNDGHCISFTIATGQNITEKEVIDHLSGFFEDQRLALLAGRSPRHMRIWRFE